MYVWVRKISLSRRKQLKISSGNARQVTKAIYVTPALTDGRCSKIRSVLSAMIILCIGFESRSRLQLLSFKLSWRLEALFFRIRNHWRKTRSWWKWLWTSFNPFSFLLLMAFSYLMLLARLCLPPMKSLQHHFKSLTLTASLKHNYSPTLESVLTSLRQSY